ncbi:MAG: tRNA (cytidine(34)-2'-O)-methyltransferase, partial [Planctomycetota bacterium]
MEAPEKSEAGPGIDVVLVHPEIPHNSGCAGRLTAAMGARLHLVEPLGFSLEDRYLKRAGLDYWPLVDLSVHGSVQACFDALRGRSDRPFEERLHLFSARGGESLREVRFHQGDILVFGSESEGLPPELLEAHADRRVRIPIHEGVRSINLANAVAIAVFL